MVRSMQPAVKNSSNFKNRNFKNRILLDQYTVSNNIPRSLYGCSGFRGYVCLFSQVMSQVNYIVSELVLFNLAFCGFCVASLKCGAVRSGRISFDDCGFDPVLVEAVFLIDG